MTTENAKDGKWDCTTPPPHPFIVIELRGGPHDGQAMRVPVDQDVVELIHGDQRHTYRRVNSKPQLWHDQDALLRISQLERIRQDDPLRREAIVSVRDWIDKVLGGEGGAA